MNVTTRHLRLVMLSFCIVLLVLLVWQRLYTPVGNPPIGRSIEQDSYYHSRVKQHIEMASHITPGSTYFIGDSITENLPVERILDTSVNFGISADTTYGVAQRIPVYKSLQEASCIVIAIGVNDLSLRNTREILANYQYLLALLPEDAKVFAVGILPVELPLWYNKISSVNSALSDLNEDFPQVRFIDPGRVLEDEDGHLKKQFHVGDGLHLSEGGYDALVAEYRKILQPECRTEPQGGRQQQG